MMDEMQTSARDVAVGALRDRAGNVSMRLERLLEKASLAAQDRDLARELALGTVRRRGTLRAILQSFLARPDKKLPIPLEEILSVALYQIVYLERIPVFAAVNEAVEQTIAHRHKRQSGLVNGLLRGVARALTDHIQGSPPLAADVIPIGPNTYRKVKRPLFADPSSRPAEYLGEAFSLPLSLAERWITRCGSLEAAVTLAMHANVRAPLILRVNPLRASVDDVLENLLANSIEAKRHENTISVVLPRSMNVRTLEVFTKGWVQPQDASASSVVLAAEPQPGMKVLDFCAAPGTKTTHITELMENRGSITAVDVSEFKLDRIETNCRRLGVSIVTILLAEQVGSLEPESFDMALVDAPCSNTGVLARRAEARWRFDPDKLTELARDQYLLVETASVFVRSGGRLVYSVCSLEPEEGGEVVRKILARVPRLQLVREQEILPAGLDDPTRWCDGGYYAIFSVK
ncbi:MAG: transcription antitermination factor NusB [Planctomycetota bacterium]|jgi:16S rRNA (cytosine967-C5)-methyltransferase